MPKVLNKSKDFIPDDAVFIGRPSEFGNPFVIGKDGLRGEVIAKYESWIRLQPELIVKAKRLLKDKDLVCFCSPKECHGDILLRIANEKASS